jgi:two-component system, cell cycle response regulator
VEILIVEDEPISRRLLEYTLRRWGYEVTTTADGNEAWEVLQSPAPPSLVISDWMMPGMDGLELCHRIRSREQPGYIYLIILTARGKKEDVIKGLEAGADDYLVKPFDQEELRCRVKIGERIINLEHRILRLANTDALTGILNRRAFMEKMEIEVERAIRENSPLSLIIADLDHFKLVNDRHGHQVGDQVLQEFTRVLSTLIRPYDFLGRYGGEEFSLGFPGMDELNVRLTAERMRQKVEALDIPSPDPSQAIRITASFGAASLRRGSRETLSSLITRADNALYEAKREGRNRVSLAECCEENQ